MTRAALLLFLVVIPTSLTVACGREPAAVTKIAYPSTAKGPVVDDFFGTPVPDGVAPGRSRPADLTVSPNGRFLYETNRGPDDVAAFAIDAAGTLKLVGHVPSEGRAPGPLAVDPSGHVLIVANEGGKSLSVYSIDPSTGALGGRHAVALASSPLSVVAVRP